MFLTEQGYRYEILDETDFFAEPGDADLLASLCLKKAACPWPGAVHAEAGAAPAEDFTGDDAD